MLAKMTNNYLAWLTVGLVGGWLLCSTMAPQPLDAVASDRMDTFAMATGPVDADFEAVYMLDFLTGDLVAAVLGKNTRAFTARFDGNVMRDLQIDPSKNPKFLMVTGMANIRRGGSQLQPSASVLYVAEVTTGRIAAYAIPWSASLHNAGKPMQQPLVLIASAPFRGPMPR
jgi:hypothetical protein